MKRRNSLADCPRLHGAAGRFSSRQHFGPMADRDRRGMLITNNETDPVQVSLSSRQLRLEPGEETFITPDEVRAPTLRDALQERSIAIVRPATPDEDKALRDRFDNQ